MDQYEHQKQTQQNKSNSIPINSQESDFSNKFQLYIKAPQVEKGEEEDPENQIHVYPISLDNSVNSEDGDESSDAKKEPLKGPEVGGEAEKRLNNMQQQNIAMQSIYNNDNYIKYNPDSHSYGITPKRMQPKI